jgi:hypothetical protein
VCVCVCVCVRVCVCVCVCVFLARSSPFIISTITQVNNVSTVEVTHAEAVSALKLSAGGRVQMIVSRLPPQEEEVLTIDFPIGDAGLGFSIFGGADQHVDMTDAGVIIMRIMESGAAAADGRLQCGDRYPPPPPRIHPAVSSAASSSLLLCVLILLIARHSLPISLTLHRTQRARITLTHLLAHSRRAGFWRPTDTCSST